MNAIPSSRYLTASVDTKVLTITINRPEVYNALHREAKREMQSLLLWAAENKGQLVAVIITGQGKAFCSGQDLGDRAAEKNPAGSVDLGHTLETEWNPLIQSIKDCPLPVIAAINGVAAGAGMSVALACDLLFSAPQVKFVSGFAKLGLCPDAGSTFTIVRALGKARTFEFFVLGKPLLSEDALAYGLLNAIDTDVMARARQVALQFNQCAPLSTSLIKKNIAHAQDQSWQQMLEIEVATQRKLGKSLDYQEGVKAFSEKRSAHFKGH